MPLPMGAHVGLGMRTITAFFLAWIVALSSFAQSNEDVADSKWQRSGVDYATQDALCIAAHNPANTTQPYTRFVMRGTPPARALDCYQGPAGGSDGIFAGGAEVCPVGFTANQAVGHQHCDRPTTCAAKAGQSKTMNFTIGWARTNNPNDNSFPVVNNPIGTSPCDGACVVTVGASPTAAWHSQVPAANGLHRVSVDMPVTYTGAACQGGPTPNADPNAAPPPCPGFVGQVNGKPVCVGTPSAPLPTNPRPPGIPPEGTGNPAAGDKPTSGTGAGSDGPGRTPTTGNGGNAGGGSNAAIPGGGSEGNGQGNGTSNPTNPDGSPTAPTTPTEQSKPCGIAGQPACKIDETGTPTGIGAYDGAKGAFDSAQGNLISSIDEAGRKVSSLPWVFNFGLPTGGCSALAFTIKGKEFKADPCNSPAVALWRSLLGWLVFGLAAIYLWRSATAAVAGGK